MVASRRNNKFDLIRMQIRDANLNTYLLLRGHLCAKMDVRCRGRDLLANCLPALALAPDGGRDVHPRLPQCDRGGHVRHLLTHGTSAASAHSWDEWCTAASSSSSQPGTSPGHAAGSRSAMAGSQPAMAGSGASQPSMHGLARSGGGQGEGGEVRFDARSSAPWIRRPHP